MKALILEDNRMRKKIFEMHLGNEYDLYFYDQVEDARKAIETAGPFDLIFLDHDLDGRIFVDSEEDNTGFQLAKYISEMDLDARIVLHSMNPIGAARMKEVLPEAEQIEFDELFPEWP
jgi:hypothetical protein